MKNKAVIFDLDGVLTDTAKYHLLAWKRLAKEEKLFFNEEIGENLRGLSREHSLKYLLQGHRLGKEQAQEMMDRKNYYYQEMTHHITSAHLFEGATGLLIELKRNHKKIAVASTSKNARRVINRLGIADQIDIIADGYDVEKPKPAPDIYFHVANQLGVRTSDCVVIEDAPVGIVAAKAAGMKVIGIGSVKVIGKADKVVMHLSDITLDSISALL